jgi:hypothetical protein
VVLLKAAAILAKTRVLWVLCFGRQMIGSASCRTP